MLMEMESLESMGFNKAFFGGEWGFLEIRILACLFTELPGGTFFQGTEAAVEIRQVVEADVKRDLDDGLIGLHQFFTGLPNSEFIDVLNECLAGIGFKKPAE